MTAKEKQGEFVKMCLKPLLKANGYKVLGNTWWKSNNKFITIINLQNYSWNSKNSVDFRFNIGVSFNEVLKDPEKKKVSLFDLVTHLSESSFIPSGENRKYGNNIGYSIKDTTDLNDFCGSVKSDFETYILPKFNEPQTLDDLVKLYEPFVFSADNLKRVIAQYNLQ